MLETDVVAAALVSMAAMAAWSVAAGQDVNWDLRNYHFWGVYAWLHGRHSFDVAPAQVQSWLNPLPYAPQYLLIQHTRPIVAGAVLGAAAGINGMLLYVLTRRIIGSARDTSAVVLAGVVTVTGLTAPMFLSQVGTTLVDAYGSILVLGAVLQICREHPIGFGSVTPGRGYLRGGVLLGVAVGLKLTYAAYAIGMTLTLLSLWPRLSIGWRRVAWYAAGGLAGAAASGGWWWAKLWAEYHNPVFPFYNAIFQSPLYDWVNYDDQRFVPASLSEAVSYPFQWSMGKYVTSDLPFRDARFAVISVLLPIVFVALVVSGPRRRSSSGGHPSAPMVASDHFWIGSLFFVLSYVVWIVVWAHQRYATALELLAGLILFLCVDRLVRRTAAKMATFAILSVCVICWGQFSHWGRIPYGKDWFGVQVSPGTAQPDTLYIVASGGEGISYVIPFLPGTSRFVRLTGNLPLRPETGLAKRAKEIVDTHEGPIRTLSAGARPSRSDLEALDRLGLRLDETPCDGFASRLQRFLVCSVSRRSHHGNPSRGQGAASGSREWAELGSTLVGEVQVLLHARRKGSPHQ